MWNEWFYKRHKVNDYTVIHFGGGRGGASPGVVKQNVMNNISFVFENIDIQSSTP